MKYRGERVLYMDLLYSGVLQINSRLSFFLLLQHQRFFINHAKQGLNQLQHGLDLLR
jgi:hypothetical protein